MVSGGCESATIWRRWRGCGSLQARRSSSMGMPGHTGHSGESDEEGAASQSCTVVRQQPDTSCGHIRPRASECQVRLNVAGVQTCRMKRQVQIQWPPCTSSFKRSTQHAGVWTRQCRDQGHGCASPGA